MWTGTILERPGESLPEVRCGRGVVEQVAGAQYGVHGIAPCDIEDRRDDVHPGARQPLLRLLGETRKSSPEMPIRGVQKPQHDVPWFMGTIRNATWKSRVTVGARYRSS